MDKLENVWTKVEQHLSESLVYFNDHIYRNLKSEDFANYPERKSHFISQYIPLSPLHIRHYKSSVTNKIKCNEVVLVHKRFTI